MGLNQRVLIMLVLLIGVATGGMCVGVAIEHLGLLRSKCAQRERINIEDLFVLLLLIAPLLLMALGFLSLFLLWLSPSSQPYR
jgi:hypothetical protein